MRQAHTRRLCRMSDNKHTQEQKMHIPRIRFIPIICCCYCYLHTRALFAFNISAQQHKIVKVVEHQQLLDGPLRMCACACFQAKTQIGCH